MMDDLISRQAAIDLLKKMRKDGDMVPWEGKDVFARIRKLPSAQPETNCSEIPNNSDLISRKTAIDALDGNVIVTSRESAQAVMDYIRGCADRMRSLPSAQPEHIHCKECRWFEPDRHQCGRQICAVFYEDDYCSFAERKTDD